MAPVLALDLDAPWHTDTLLQVRTAKMQPMRNLSITTGIYKVPRNARVFCSTTGLAEDEHDLTFHGGVDKAVHQYYPGHYAKWRAEYPEAENFEIGGFGENLVSERMNERNVCIGDKIRIGEALLQVSLPRQPCFKLNHRFSLKAFASQTWKKSRTGWYYRVLEEGWMGAGDNILLVERPHPQWTIERIQEYLHRNTKNLEKLQEVCYNVSKSLKSPLNFIKLERINEFGNECKGAFKSLVAKCQAAEQERDKKKEPEKWSEFELIEKNPLTPRITSFVFSKIGADPGEELDPGTFVRLKLPDGMIRPYSVVSGFENKFELGIAKADASRGGSRYLHEVAKKGDKILVGNMKISVPITGGASNHIFISGGIGITAFLHHLDLYDRINYNYTLHYAARSSDEIAYREIIAKKGSRVIVYDGSKGQRMNVSDILRNRVWNSFVYVCGPQRLLDDVIRSSNELGISQEDIHYEAFQIATSGDPFSVELKRDKKVFQVGEEQTLLQVLRNSGLEIESSCEAGNCGTCRVEVCSGKVEHRGSGLAEEDKDKAMLSCVSRGVGKLVIDF